MPEFIDICEKAARAGGQVLLDWQGKFRAREKAPKDLVTEADFAAQQTIRQIVLGAYPDHGFLGEEDGGADPGSDSASASAEYCWIVDPLDGTANYVHDLPTYSTSVALRHRDEIVAGVVYDPVMDECFAAGPGIGAMLNGSPIRASGCVELRSAMVAASFSANVSRDSPEIKSFVEVVCEAQAVRRLGSAALNLCYLAAGRLDAYWATSVKIWDVAAGLLLLREAGGVMVAPDGSPFVLDQPRFAAAATQQLLQQLVGVLRRVPL